MNAMNARNARNTNRLVSTLPAAASLRAVPASDENTCAVLGRGITCLAGFYTSATQAEEAVRQMTLPSLGVLPTQLSLIAPTDGVITRLRRSRQRWALRRGAADRRWFDDRRLMTCLAVVAGAVAVTCGLLLEDSELDMSLLFLTMMGTGLAALIAGAVALLGHQQPQYRRFNDMVRRQLDAKRWVVLLHDLPPMRQDAAFALVREHSHGWCVASANQPWL